MLVSHEHEYMVRKSIYLQSGQTRPLKLVCNPIQVTYKGHLPSHMCSIMSQILTRVSASNNFGWSHSVLNLGSSDVWSDMLPLYYDTWYFVTQIGLLLAFSKSMFQYWLFDSLSILYWTCELYLDLTLLCVSKPWTWIYGEKVNYFTKWTDKTTETWL